MPTVRHALIQSIALVLALGVAACGKEEAAQPAAKPSSAAPASAPASAPQTAAPPALAPAAKSAPAVTAAPDPDAALAKKVKKVLETTQGVTGQQIDVTVKGGAVTLWGTVADPKEQAMAVEAAKAVPGVKAVENKLAVVKGS
jgi:hyperosmotically inducible protein